MHKILSLILLFQTTFTQPISPTCTTSCANVPNSPACYTDGFVYANSCLASCANTTNYSYFVCNSLNNTLCQTTCSSQIASYNCQKNCHDIDTQGQISCASNGNIHSSLCKAQCSGLATTFLFNCNNIYYNNLNCRSVCTPFYNSMVLCSGQPIDYLCSNVGIIYINVCHLNANKAVMLLPMSANDLPSQEMCVAIAQSSGGSVGPLFRKKQ